MMILVRLIARTSLCARSVMITVRIAQLVMTATVMYPVPGGVSQSRSLKMIMATNSAIVSMAPKAVVPHNTATSCARHRHGGG